MKRSAYLSESNAGYANLYCDSILIADIDSTPLCDFDSTSKVVQSFSSENGVAFRLYKTFAGFRAICVSHHFKATSGAARRILEALSCDPRYMEVSRRKNTFSARVSPKPERVGAAKDAGFSFHSLLPLEQRRWLDDYEAKSSGYKVCEFILQTPISEKEIPNTIRKFVRIHDEMTRCFTALPLA